MTIVKINAITVPGEAGGEIARRFAERAAAVDGMEGFEGFELLRPTDDRDTWLVITRWAGDESFERWVESPQFAHGHRGAREAGGSEGRAPVSISAELWSYSVEVSRSPS